MWTLAFFAAVGVAVVACRRRPEPPRVVEEVPLAGSYRCSTCGRSWPPNYLEYAKCPGLNCEDRETAWVGNQEPDFDAAEARSVKNHLLFEKFVLERDQKREAEFSAITAGVSLDEPQAEEATSD